MAKETPELNEKQKPQILTNILELKLLESIPLLIHFFYS